MTGTRNFLRHTIPFVVSMLILLTLADFVGSKLFPNQPSFTATLGSMSP
jgi:hypothetical protein